jgi:RNA-binding protein
MNPPTNFPTHPAPTPRQRKQLRAMAHPLTPVVQVGASGITDAVVEATDAALNTHELIKVRMREPENKQAMAAELATRTKSTLCGLVGHTVILYKPHPTEPKIQL